MSKKETKNEVQQEAAQEEVLDAQTAQTEEAPAEQPAEQPADQTGRQAEAAQKEAEEKYLRLAAEYDNYRKRTAKEKEALWADAKVDTIKQLLPVYDNLERAMNQETSDDAFKKGVEMTMTQMKEVLEKLGVTEIPALGQPFDPNLHNAVMHIESEDFGENTISQVFQAGFQCGEKIVRFAMVQVAN